MATSILHIGYCDKGGGAARDAYRVHSSLRGAGWQSRMMVGVKKSDDPDVRTIAGPTRLHRLADRLAVRVADHLSRQYLHIPSSSLLLEDPWVRDADVIHFYNLWGGFLSHTILPKLNRDRPVIWRLCDEWLFTGHCVYDYGCDRWKTGCGECPQVDGEIALRRDTSAFLWQRKKAILDRCNLAVVAPSSWIADLASQSPLLDRFGIHHIPNGVDTNVFRPIDRSAARRVLDIPEGARLVMFSAQALTSTRKGGHLLVEALRAFKPTRPAELLLVGGGGREMPAIPGWAVRDIGYTDNDLLLATAYCAADLFVLPTLADNMPNGVLESMACGTPVAAFDVGGIRDMVRHMKTGYLAGERDAGDLAKGIELLIEEPALGEQMGRRCRQVVLEEYPIRRELNDYQALLEGCLASCPG